MYRAMYQYHPYVVISYQLEVYTFRLMHETTSIESNRNIAARHVHKQSERSLLFISFICFVHLFAYFWIFGTISVRLF